MKLLLAVQGEGRGHMTQALAVQQWSRRQGHSVVAVLAGTNRSRSWPDFFERGFEVPVEPLPSPGFVFSRGRAVSLPATVWQFVTRIGEFRRSCRRLDETVRRTQPDLVINFLEPLIGCQTRRGALKTPVLAVGHQFMLDDPNYVKAEGAGLSEWGFRQYVRFTGWGATRYALSLYPSTPRPSEGWLTGPPLLRDGVFGMPTYDEDFLLVYLLNEGYRADVERWHRRRPDIALHCFYDRPGAPETETVDSSLTFHRLHGERFLKHMARCRGVACTAGFESLSEAACLGKPILAIPVESHIEQTLNALDLERSGLGLAGHSFDLERLLEPKRDRRATARFREWLSQSDDCLARAVRLAARQPATEDWAEMRVRPAPVAHLNPN